MHDDPLLPFIDPPPDDEIRLEVEKCRTLSGCAILKPCEPISGNALNWLVEQTSKVIKAGFRMLIVDCSGLSYFGTPAFSYLIDLRKRLIACGGSMVLLQTSAWVRGRLQLTGFESQFAFADSAEAATEAIRKLMSGRPTPSEVWHRKGR
jgi:anti-anti-sigma factor